MNEIDADAKRYRSTSSRDSSPDDGFSRGIEQEDTCTILLFDRASDESSLPPKMLEDERRERLECRREVCETAELIVKYLQDCYDHDPMGGWFLSFEWESPSQSLSEWSLFANGRRIARGSIDYLVESKGHDYDLLETSFRGAIAASGVERLSHQALMVVEIARALH